MGKKCELKHSYSGVAHGAQDLGGHTVMGEGGFNPARPDWRPPGSASAGSWWQVVSRQDPVVGFTTPACSGLRLHINSPRGRGLALALTVEAASGGGCALPWKLGKRAGQTSLGAGPGQPFWVGSSREMLV